MTAKLKDVPKQRLFSTRAAALYLGMSRDQVRKLADLGELPARRLGGNRKFILDDLNNFIDNLPRWADSRLS